MTGAAAYLADTSVFARTHLHVIREALLALGPLVARTTVVDLEIGFSARNASEWDELHASFDAFRRVDVEPHHLRRALHVQRLLAEAGLRGRKPPDLITAACAEDHGLTVLHYDADYDHIASVTGQPTEWVVPAGSID